MRLRNRALAFAVLVAGAILPNISPAQVIPAIKGGGSQINVYGLYALVNPDGKATVDYPPGCVYPCGFLNAGNWNQGGAVGADFRLGRFIFGQPALGARLTFSTGSFAKEKTYMFGPELHYAYRHFRPYGDFLLGKGDITYANGFEDDSIVYEFGGGVDYHFNRRWSARLVDFQYQFWNLSTHYYPPGLSPGQPGQYIDTTLKPLTLGFGVLYRIK